MLKLPETRCLGPVRAWLGPLLAGFALAACAQHAPEPPELPNAQAAARPTAAPLLRFADFFQSTTSARGLTLSPALRQANGKRVRLVGYMVQQEQMPAGRFLFTPRPVRMSEHADGDADDLPANWVMVYLDATQQHYAAAYQRGLLELVGVLQVGRLEEVDGRVSWVRLQLDADATHSMQTPELAHHLQTQGHAH